MAEKETCKYFETCSAPLCPEDPESLDHAAWFPDEETCRKMPRPGWVSRQNTIARKLEKDFDAGCFTLAMLKRRCIFTKSTKGVDPDKGAPHDLEKAWLQKHPEYRESKKQAAARKKTGISAGKPCKKDAVPRGSVGVSAAGSTQGHLAFESPRKETFAT